MAGTTCDAGIPEGNCFESWLSHFWINSLQMAWEKHHKIAQAFCPCHHVGGYDGTPGFSLAQPQGLCPPGDWTRGWKISIFPSFSITDIQRLCKFRIHQNWHMEQSEESSEGEWIFLPHWFLHAELFSWLHAVKENIILLWVPTGRQQNSSKSMGRTLEAGSSNKAMELMRLRDLMNWNEYKLEHLHSSWQSHLLTQNFPFSL